MPQLLEEPRDEAIGCSMDYTWEGPISCQDKPFLGSKV